MFVFLFALVIISAATYITYITTIVRPDGQESSGDWPRQYAESFEGYITLDNGIPEISREGQESLARNELWLQVLDENGIEITQHNKPSEIPDRYTFSNLLDLANSNRLNDYAVFPVSSQDHSFEYIIGFPINVLKVTTYFNSDRYEGGRPVVLVVVIGLSLLVLVAGGIYGAWLTKHIAKIEKSVRDIPKRTYQPHHTNGAFADAYNSLNLLDQEIRLSDESRAATERMREEWIVNITHDLKTPLSPIKGYVELLIDEQYAVSPNEVRQYGQIILKNILYTEQLINDLKLTYQIDSGTIPINMQTVNLSREIKEIVIDLLNNPDYMSRDIAYHGVEGKVAVHLDVNLFRRAISNIIINALVHNSNETKIVISMEVNDSIIISIRDNGKGLTDEETKKLFTRYYRGANMDEKPEGSGLGLAIAKQIVELHSGKIDIQSQPHKGTDIMISLPKNINPT